MSIATSNSNYKTIHTSQEVFSHILNDDVYHADERVAMKNKRVACKLINMQRYNQQFTGKFHTFSQLATYVATHA